MTFYTVGEARAYGVSKARAEYGGASEALRKARTGSTFDIFLSHSMRDAELVLGIREILQRSGQRVYVDWIDDPELDRSRVSARTAARLRERMRQCRSLIYAFSAAASGSKWMPWELGYFDGFKTAEAVAIMPILDYQGQALGQEYIDLYPKIEKPPYSTGAPIVTREGQTAYRKHKSLPALVEGRGGAAWS